MSVQDVATPEGVEILVGHCVVHLQNAAALPFGELREALLQTARATIEDVFDALSLLASTSHENDSAIEARTLTVKRLVDMLDELESLGAS